MPIFLLSRRSRCENGITNNGPLPGPIGGFGGRSRQSRWRNFPPRKNQPQGPLSREAPVSSTASQAPPDQVAPEKNPGRFRKRSHHRRDASTRPRPRSRANLFPRGPPLVLRSRIPGKCRPLGLDSWGGILRFLPTRIRAKFNDPAPCGRPEPPHSESGVEPAGTTDF